MAQGGRATRGLSVFLAGCVALIATFLATPAASAAATGSVAAGTRTSSVGSDARPATSQAPTTPPPLLTLDLSGVLGTLGLGGRHTSSAPPAPAGAPPTSAAGRTDPPRPSATRPSATRPSATRAHDATVRTGSAPDGGAASPDGAGTTASARGGVGPALATAANRPGSTPPVSVQRSQAAVLAQDFVAHQRSFVDNPLVVLALLTVFTVAVGLIVRAGGHRSSRHRSTRLRSIRHR